MADIPRRTLLASTAGLAAGLLLPPRRGRARAPEPLYLAANTGRDGTHRFSALREDGSLALDVTVPVRAHGCAVRPGAAEVAVFARRPDRVLVVVDLERGRTVATVDAAPGRHFYGHGVYSPDGTTLYATENAYDEEDAGRIGVYDATNGYRRLGEMRTGGIGPHEIRLMPDGKTLVVANGGIRTHPDMARVKLNLPVMDPSLAYIDRATGTLVEQVRQPEALHQNSMRHLAVAPSGRVVSVQQWQGPAEETPPLVAVHDRGGALRLLSAPPGVQARMRNYCGSVCLDAAGQSAAVSAPRGGLVTLWDMEAERFIAAVEVPDGCGVAPAAEGGFMVTSGTGGAWHLHGGKLSGLPHRPSGRRWDNHLSAANAARPL